MNIHTTALPMLQSGLCVLPAIPAEKRPSLSGWKAFQAARPNETQIKTWFVDAPGLCLVCGAVSGNLEMIDFDAQGEMFTAWWEKVEATAPGLFDRLVVEQTPSGGYHVAYRCTDSVPGNQRLAQRSIICDSPNPIEIHGKKLVPRKIGGRWEVLVTLIETRGEGGLFLCDPAPGYKLQQGNFCQLPVLTAAERDILINAAQSLNEHVERSASSAPHDSHETSGGRPGDDFNSRSDIRSLLTKHGWTQISQGENEHWRRPGKDCGTSATLKDGVFYVFSTSAAPFEADRGYSPFQVYSLLEHNGDFAAAARELRTAGFGDDTENLPKVDLSSFLSKVPNPPAKDAEAAALPLSDLFESINELDPPLIHGLLREGETMNVIACPKAGKSWLVMKLAISIASGLDWFGMPVEYGHVLHIDNELRLKTIVYRYRKIAEALKVPPSLFSHNLDIKSLRGQLQDLNGLGAYFTSLEPGKYKAIIIDAFYRTLPIGVDENDNGAIANLYNKLDWYASRLQCAFILIHHSSKGNQSQKSITDVGAGAGAQSRAADTHLILRPHEESNVAVLEAAVRSWPPRAPMCLRWEFPLWHPATDLDPAALHGKPATHSSIPSKHEWTVEEFIKTCVMPFDPCVQTKIIYEAGQLDIPERRARTLIELGLEEGLLLKEKDGSRAPIVAVRDGIPAGKAQMIAAKLIRDPNQSIPDLAVAHGVSERYVRQVRQAMEGVPVDGELIQDDNH